MNMNILGKFSQVNMLSAMRTWASTLDNFHTPVGSEHVCKGVQCLHGSLHLDDIKKDKKTDDEFNECHTFQLCYYFAT